MEAFPVDDKLVPHARCRDVELQRRKVYQPTSHLHRFLGELLLRLPLLTFFVVLNKIPSHMRRVPRRLWIYHALPFTQHSAISTTAAVVMVLATVTSYLASLSLWHFMTLKRVRSWCDGCQASLKHATRREILQASYAITFALFVTLLTTELLKVSVSRPRPDYLSRCDAAAAEKIFYGIADQEDLATAALCFENPPKTNRLLNDGRKSFPSGHSSLTAAAITTLILCTHRWARAHLVESHLQEIELLFFLSGLATIPFFVAVTRVTDHRHHVEDVSVGLALGFVWGVVSYWMYFIHEKGEEVRVHKDCLAPFLEKEELSSLVSDLENPLIAFEPDTLLCRVWSKEDARTHIAELLEEDASMGKEPV